jgi:hypothetical protein
MDNISDDVVYLDLVRHIKQYLKQYKCSFFECITEEIENVFKKHEIGEELTVEEFIMLADYILLYNLKKNFKEIILSNDSIALPDDISQLYDDVYERFSKEEIYLLYESYYVMKFLNEARSKILRACSLSKLLINEGHYMKVNEYCKEAYLCYLDGHFNASIIILRATIEQALKEKYNLKMDFGTLGAIRNHLSNNGQISDELRKKITKIALAGNKAVHNRDKQASESNNKYLIAVAQDILHSLFN